MSVSSLVIKAVKHGDLTALKDAIRSEPNLNATDSQGWTALSHAAHRGWTDGIKTIIEAGADVNHGVETGFTALFSAVINGHIEAVQILLVAGAKVRDLQGIRLTHYAQGKRRLRIIALLEQAEQNDSTRTTDC